MIAESKKRVALTLDIQVLDVLQQLAWQEKMTKSEYIEKLTIEKLQERGKENECEK